MVILHLSRLRTATNTEFTFMKKTKITNLEYLREITGEEPSIMKEMIELFITQMPEFLDNMKKQLAEKNYVDLGREAHKAKSSVLIVGMEEAGKALKNLQMLTETGKDVEQYPSYVKVFSEVCDAAVEELKEELKNL